MPEAGRPPTPSTSERPTGVLCLTCFMIIGGVANIGLGVTFSPIYAIVGIANIIIAIFFYQLKYWAWMITIILQVISMISYAITIILIPVAIINLVIIWYLNQPHIKALFQEESSTQDW
jgi:hypothetical protein